MKPESTGSAEPQLGNNDTSRIADASAHYRVERQLLDVPPGYKRTEVGVIPEDWDAVPLVSLFEFKNGLNKAKRFFGIGTPIVNYMDVFSHPGLRLADLKGRVTLSLPEIKNFEVRRGDVFFTRTSETVDEIGVAAVMLEGLSDFLCVRRFGLFPLQPDFFMSEPL